MDEPSSPSFNIRNVPDDALVGEYFRRVKCKKFPERRLVMFGPPGSGKGTQAPKLSDEYCWCHLSTGDVLRSEIKKGSDLGKKVQGIMAAGQLVPDDVVIDIIKGTMGTPECKRGLILDGFPRTMEQAKKLDDMFASQGSKLDKVISLEIDDDVLLDRLEGRRIHEPSGRSYHLKYNPPKVAGKDDVTGENLIQRPDDKREVIQKRIATYHKFTKSVLDYYANTGILKKINANQPIEKVNKAVDATLF